MIRILTGAVAGAASVALIWFSPLGLWAFCALISVFGIAELMTISGIRSLVIIAFGVLFSTLVWLSVAAEFHLAGIVIPYEIPLLTLSLLILLAIPVMGIVLLWLPDEKKPLQIISSFAFGVVYVLVPFFLFFDLSMRAQPNVGSYNADAIFPLGILFLIWATDIFAYFGGRFLGRHKLFERISPKKTWEGSLIGAAACIGTGFLLNHFWPLTGWDWRIAAGIVAVFSQLGDLVESIFKRSLDLKDSGGLLPGHGGILDRFDGFLISMPFLTAYYLITHSF